MKWVTENEVIRWHIQFSGCAFKQTVGDSEGQGSKVCCSRWGYKELDVTEQRNNNMQRFTKKCDCKG